MDILNIFVLKLKLKCLQLLVQKLETCWSWGSKTRTKLLQGCKSTSER